MAVNVSDISSKMWSINVTSLGDVVTDEQDVRQCVMLIVMTVPGSVPFLADFGCDFFNHIDQPAASAAPLMVRDIRNAVTKWETRATVINTNYRIEGANIDLSLEMRLNSAPTNDPIGSFFIDFRLDTTTGKFYYLTDQYGRRINTSNGFLMLQK